MRHRPVFVVCLLVSGVAFGTRMIEKLDRGVVAIPNGNGIFISWRLQGYEPLDLGFNLYRDGALLNSTPLAGTAERRDNCTADKTGESVPVFQ
jgi:rhamnogalacturonan endolyase